MKLYTDFISLEAVKAAQRWNELSWEVSNFQTICKNVIEGT